jgi:hypothetical protein
MTDLVLVPSALPVLPPDEAIRWRAPVASPGLIALADAAIHLGAARSLRSSSRTFTPYIDSDPIASEIADPAQTHRQILEPSPMARRYTLRIQYQADPDHKGSQTITAQLRTITAVVLDTLTWDGADGRLLSSFDAFDVEPSGAPRGRQFGVYELITPPRSRPAAGAVVSRPLEIGGGTYAELELYLSVTSTIRILTIEPREMFEEGINQ